MDYVDGASGASSNNSAGRVLKCLAPVIARAAQQPMATKLARALGTDADALEFPLLCASLRMEIHRVPEDVAPYLKTMRRASHSFDGYERVLAASDLLLNPSTPELAFRQAISDKGWSALCWADAVLRDDSREAAVEANALADLVDQIRGLIDEVLA